jgi:hypothetical protein
MLQNTFTQIGIATALAGMLSPFLTHITKTVFGVDSLRAYAIHLGASALTAVAAMAITGDLTLSNFGTQFPVVAMTAQSLFHIYKAASGLKVSPAPPEETPPVE